MPEKLSEDAPTDVLTVASRFNGPPRSANGGYISGRLAEHVAAPAVRVRLRTPPPLETPMTVRRDPAGGVRLERGEGPIAEAVAVPEPAVRVEPVTLTDAEQAQANFRGHTGHPFPTCFVCGVQRESGDGLRLFPGPVRTAPDGDTVACVWTPDQAHTATEMVWAALDCPGGWSSDIIGRPMLLGQMTATVHARPRADQPHVVMGRLLSEEGRKVFTASTLYDADGTELARAEAIWIMIQRS